MSVDSVAKFYDKIAKKYEDEFTGDKYRNEDRILGAILRAYYNGGYVLDVGCGIGTLLDVLDVDRRKYLGIDISEEMIKIAKRRYEGYRFYVGDVNSISDGEFDLITMLYGVASYLSKEEILRCASMLSDDGVLFMMFYKEDYYPKTYELIGEDLRKYWRSKPSDVNGEKFILFCKYIVVVSGKRW